VTVAASVPKAAGSALADHIAAVPLIDQHMHGCWLAAGGPAAV